MTGAENQDGNVIEARGLTLSFGSTPALRGASLAVRRGEIVAVMGPSGSGKSTPLHCLAGILVPGEGEVWFGGRRLDSLSDDRRSVLRRNRFGFVFQSGQLVPELTAEENVALPLLLSGAAPGGQRGRSAPASPPPRCSPGCAAAPDGRSRPGVLPADRQRHRDLPRDYRRHTPLLARITGPEAAING